jgi:hypothetical protein
LRHTLAAHTDSIGSSAEHHKWRFGFHRGVMVGRRDQLGAPA